MKSLLKNYIEKLTLDELREFGEKHGINISNDEYKLILDLVQGNFEDMLTNEDKYLKIIESKINKDEFIKIKNLYYEYKEKYKGYLF